MNAKHDSTRRPQEQSVSTLYREGSARARPSNLEQLDAFLNALIGDASAPDQIRYWTIKRDFKASLNQVDDEGAERLAGRLLRELEAEAA